MPAGKQKKIQPKLFTKVVENYLKECEEQEKAPFKKELAFILGLDDSTIGRYAQDKRYSRALKRLERMGEITLARKVEKSSQVGPMFLLKAMFGYSEKQQIDITSGGNTLGVVMLPPKPNRAITADSKVIEASPTIALPSPKNG